MKKFSDSQIDLSLATLAYGIASPVCGTAQKQFLLQCWCQKSSLQPHEQGAGYRYRYVW